MYKYIIGHGAGAVLRIEIEDPEDLEFVDAYLEHMKSIIRGMQAEEDTDIELLQVAVNEWMEIRKVSDCLVREWEGTQ